MDRETERPLGAAAEEGTRAVRGLAAAAQDILGELEAALGGAHARQGGKHTHTQMLDGQL